LSFNLINILKASYPDSKIDILVNSDTLQTAKLNHEINSFISFSYDEKKKIGLRYIVGFLKKYKKKYDLAINLTASDRSVFFASLFGKQSISFVERSILKSWWKRTILTKYYIEDLNSHVMKDIIRPLEFLKIYKKDINFSPSPSLNSIKKVDKLIKERNINKFFIFHPCAQYSYKVCPEVFRNDLIRNLLDIGIDIVVTGGNSKIDQVISASIEKLPRVHNLIGKISIDDFLYLSLLSEAYIGMDTLNMHIAASQNKKIFAIFGPSIPGRWGPFLRSKKNIKNYSSSLEPEIFQSNMSCVPCGKAGCGDKHIKSDCLHNIPLTVVLDKVKNWYLNT